MYMFIEELKNLENSEEAFFFEGEFVDTEERAEEIVNDNKEELLSGEKFICEAVKAHVEIDLYDILNDYFVNLEENSEIPEDWDVVLINSLPDRWTLEEMNKKIEKELPSFYMEGDPIGILDVVE